MKKTLTKILTIVFTMALFLSLFSDYSYADSSTSNSISDSKIVRIGFPKHAGFNLMDKDGNKSGYSYELIENMRIFNNWEVEYVGYDLSWNEMFDMLDNGDIDLLFNASVTEERSMKYLYSDYSIYSTECSLFAKAGNYKFDSERYLEYPNLNIGFLKGDYTYNLFDEFAKENNYSYNPVFYATEDELHAALVENNEIDLIGYVGYRKVQGEVYADTFCYDNGYIIASRSNPKLIAEVNDSLNNLLLIYPNIFDELNNKYFTDSTSKRSLFSLREEKYIAEHKNKTFNVLLSGDMEPMAYTENGEAKGILPDYISLLSAVSGLSLNPVFVNCHDNYYDAFDLYDASIRADAINDFNAAGYYGYKLSIPYLEIPMGKITRVDRNNYGEIKGFLYSPDSGEALKTVTEEKYDIGFENIKEAIDGLISGDIDYFYAPLYVCTYFCNNNSYPIEYEKTDYSFNLCFGVKDEESFLLTSILSKSINQINENDVREIFAKNFDFDSKETFSFQKAIDESPWFIYGVTIFTLFVISFLVILIIRASIRQRERRVIYEKNALFKAALSANMFAVRLDIKDNEKEYYYYHTTKLDNDSEPLIKVSVINEKDIIEFKSRVYSDDINIFEHIMSDSNINYVLNSKAPDYSVIRLLSNEGEYEYASITLQKMDYGDGKKHVLAFFKNINENRKAEEEKIKTLSLALETAKKYSESKSLFLSQMSHDIRTPMNAIAGMAQLALLNIDNKDKLEECLNIINSSSDHLVTLLSDVLDMSKIEKGILAFSNRTIDIVESFDKAVSIHSDKIIKNQILLNVDKEKITHRFIYTDPARLEQVFSNIISNACKYTNPGGKISIRLYEDDPKDNVYFYEFEVTDTGIGMSESFLSNIFNPFERAKEAEFVDGSGLGMSITKNIVDAIGGVINITSKEGVGTTVKITLPFTEKEKEVSEETLPKKAKKKSLTVTGKGKRALIVEDVEINAMFASAITEMKGFKADVCENGREAVKMLEGSNDGYYSIVLMDIQMPVMNGYEATKKIRSSGREYLKKIPIIAMSANTFEDDIIKCKNVGMNDHISKPVEINRFSEIVDMYVKD